MEVDNIIVGKRYYSFNYRLFINNKLVKDTTFDTSHSRSPNSIRKWLKKDWAYDLILQEYFN